MHENAEGWRSGLRLDMARIIDAAIRAVNPESLVPRLVSVVDGDVAIGGPHPGIVRRGDSRGRIVIVGGGKASAGMAAGLVDVLLRGGVDENRITGIVSVPEGCGRVVPGIDVRETRPATENVPTAKAVAATREMLAVLGSLAADDIVLAVISGGGSALLAAPTEGVPLEEKVAIARFLAATGAPITAINAVRRTSSDVKGGGLARACTAGRMIVLVLSDVIGDPLESIASGPGMPAKPDAGEALGVLDRYGAVAAGIVPRLVALLQKRVIQEGLANTIDAPATGGSWTTPRGCRVDHVMLGTNATAVDAAAAEAIRLGYAAVVRHANPRSTEVANDTGQRLAGDGLALAAAATGDGGARAIIEGGEAVVRLPPNHGAGGRNQQTVLAALAAMSSDGRGWPRGLALASVGTDGVDGPTHAAGGIADARVAARIAEVGLDAAKAIDRCDALPLLLATDGLVVTGPTGTNVADIRVLLAVPAGD